MEEPLLPGDEAYDDAEAPSPRKMIDESTFKKPIKSIGLRRSVILGQDVMIAEAIEAMRAARIGSVLVTGPDGKLVGIFTERDVLNRVALGEANARTTPVRDVMHAKLEILSPEDDIAYALRIMSHGGYRHVPLVDREGRPVGVISVRDIVDFIADLFPDDILTLPTDPRSAIAKNPEGA